MANSIFRNNKQERLSKKAIPSELIDRKAYNLVLGGVVLYGLIANLIICRLVPNVYAFVNPLVFLFLYIVLCVCGCIMTAKSDNPVVSFVGYNLVAVPVGLVVSTSIDFYGGVGSAIVVQAFLVTSAITAVMIVLSMLFPKVFEKFGGFLFVCLIAILVGSIVELFVGEIIILSWIAAVIFSLYIGYDFWKAQQYPATIDNAVDSALDIYLDIINLFLRLLRIMARSYSKK